MVDTAMLLPLLWLLPLLLLLPRCRCCPCHHWLLPSLPLFLPEHCWWCPCCCPCYPWTRCCWTLCCQLCWNCPCCQEGGWPLLLWWIRSWICRIWWLCWLWWIWLCCCPHCGCCPCHHWLLQRLPLCLPEHCWRCPCRHPCHPWTCCCWTLCRQLCWNCPCCLDQYSPPPNNV